MLQDYDSAYKVRRMSERHHELTPGLKRALESWFEDYPQHIYEMVPIRRVLEEEKRNAISLLLESKFGPLSEELVSQFEAVHDVDELTRLYKRALQAQTLEEVGLQGAKSKHSGTKRQLLYNVKRKARLLLTFYVLFFTLLLFTKKGRSEHVHIKKDGNLVFQIKRC